MDWKKLLEQATSQENSAKNLMSNVNGLYGQAQNTDYTGDFYGLLGDMLSKQMTDGLPNLDQYQQLSEGSINKSFNNSRTSMKEDLASRGMGGSGAAMAAMAGLSGERASALGQNALGLSEMNENYKQQALGNLMNLNSVGVNAKQNQFSNILNALGLQLGQFNQNRDYQMQKDNQPSWLGSLLGSLLGAGTSVATTGFMTNWGKGNVNG